MWSRGRVTAVLLAISTSGLSLASYADAPVLHEFVEPNAAEDLQLGARTPDGQMPAAERTPSGLISAPGFLDPNAPRQVAYGGGSTPDSIDATFRLDRDTSEPSVVRYDDPFTPSVAPFKRLYAFDSVDNELELRVQQKRLDTLPMGGELPEGYDRFFGDLFVDLAPGVPVRVPTVGPGTRLLALRVEPPTKLELKRDGAENWFAVGDERKRVRLILDLAAPRSGFGSEYGEVSYSELATWATPLPPAVRASVNGVLERLGLSRALSPRNALEALVAHFRSFTPSTDLPSAQGGSALYAELVLEKKGVCRHRAFGFMLTALGLGLPARFVRNEAHAWVEVRDARIWHRIDLGGAARRFEVDTRPGAPAHALPPDPYAWPAESQSALSAAQSAAQSTSGSSSGASSDSSRRSPGAAPGASGHALPGSSASSALSVPPSSLDGEHPRSQIDLELDAPETRRGAAVRVMGRVTSAGAPCPHARVDIVLVEQAAGAQGEGALIGSVPTDATGQFDSRVTIPFDIDVGEHLLRASTPGAGECGASQ
jgi:hypothetical protein